MSAPTRGRASCGLTLPPAPEEGTPGSPASSRSRGVEREGAGPDLKSVSGQTSNSGQLVTMKKTAVPEASVTINLTFTEFLLEARPCS